MSSPKTPPNSQKPSLTSIFRNFSRKQKKIVNVSVVGADGVGKSAFVVRFLTRRFIGDYSSNICCAYPHTLALDNIPTSIIVWDTPAISTKVFHIIIPRNIIFYCRMFTRCVNSWTMWWSGQMLSCFSTVSLIGDNQPLKCTNIFKTIFQSKLQHSQHRSQVHQQQTSTQKG